MVTTEAILDVLRTIDDPEMPISIVDLGLIENVAIDDGNVTISVLPTFIGCPALPMIADDITTRVAALAGVGHTDVRFVYEPPWSVDRISDEGRASLKSHGVTVPLPGAVELRTSAIPCPFCGSDRTTLDSMFGPTRCRMIYYCNGCRNTFEHMKKLSPNPGTIA